MPKNISTLITTLLKRASVDVTDPRYIDLMNLTGQLGDEAYRDIEEALGRLLTVEEAKYHSDLRRHFRQGALDPIDKELERWLDEYAISDADRQSVLSDRNTYTKLRRALEKTQELEALKAEGKRSAEQQLIATELDRVKLQLTEQQTARSTMEAELQEQADARIREYIVRSRLQALDYAYDNLSKEEAALTFRPLLDNELKTLGATLVYNADTNDLDLVHADTRAPYTEADGVLSFTDLVSRTAAAKRVLKVNPDAATATQQHMTLPTQIPAGRDLPKSSQNALSIIESRLKGN